jgi:ankyrin repeat protein
MHSTVKDFLEQPNARVDVKHRHGRTALHPAVFAGRIGFVYLLLPSGRGLRLHATRRMKEEE